MESLESWHFLVIEDIGEATQALQARGIPHTRMSHFEVLTQIGQQHFQSVHQRKFTHLWISIPRSHHARSHETKHHSQQSKDNTHHARLLTFIKTSVQLEIPIFVFGTPGHAWTPYESVLKAQPFQSRHLRCCSLNLRYDASLPQPSRSYAKVYSTLKLPDNWPCQCQCAWKDHVLDWHGQDVEHARFRSVARQTLISSVFDAVLNTIQDRNLSPSLPRAARTFKNSKNFNNAEALHAEALPTDARIAQKERLKKMKEQGIKPQKRKQHVEEGNDDCGEDLSGLGDNIILYGCDWTSGWAETEEVYSYPITKPDEKPPGPKIIPPPHPEPPPGVHRAPY